MGIDAEMFVRTKEPITKETVLDLAWQLGSSFYCYNFWIEKDGDHIHHILEIVDFYDQDGPDIHPEPGETFIKVYLTGRYYGEGYERGNLPLYIAIAEWLEHKIPGGEVWYGGDSSGVIARPFDKKYRESLFRHFIENGHRPYTGSFSSLTSNSKYACFCHFCQKPMLQLGFGPNYSKFHCYGCDANKEVRDWDDDPEQK